MNALDQLTQRQRQIYTFIHDKIMYRGYGPTVREIGERFGISSPNGVMCHLKALEKKGLIRRSPNKSRAIELTREAIEAERGLPLAGCVAAGMTRLAFEQNERIDFGDWFNQADQFVLQVSGDSMIEAQITDGDYVVIRRRETAGPGEMVVGADGGGGGHVEILASRTESDSVAAGQFGNEADLREKRARAGGCRRRGAFVAVDADPVPGVGTGDAPPLRRTSPGSGLG